MHMKISNVHMVQVSSLLIICLHVLYWRNKYGSHWSAWQQDCRNTYVFVSSTS